MLIMIILLACIVFFLLHSAPRKIIFEHLQLFNYYYCFVPMQKHSLRCLAIYAIDSINSVRCRSASQWRYFTYLHHKFGALTNQWRLMGFISRTRFSTHMTPRRVAAAAGFPNTYSLPQHTSAINLYDIQAVRCTHA